MLHRIVVRREKRKKEDSKTEIKTGAKGKDFLEIVTRICTNFLTKLSRICLVYINQEFFQAFFYISVCRPKYSILNWVFETETSKKLESFHLTK